MWLHDFCDGVNFLKNATEFGLLDDDAKAALSAHHAKLVSGNCTENDKMTGAWVPAVRRKSSDFPRGNK